MHIGDVADRARLDDLHHTAVIVPGVDLSSQLRRHSHFFRSIGDDPRLLHGMRERLLAIDVQSLADCADGGRGMVMVGAADNNRVNLVSLGFEHLTVVSVAAAVGELLEDGFEVVAVDIGEGDEVLLLHASDVGSGAIGRADTGDVKLVARRRGVVAAGESGE